MKLALHSTLLLAALLLPIGVQAHTAVDTLAQPGLIIGYFSYDRALRSLAEYEQAEEQLEQLAAQYAAETQRVEDEFNAKYENFLKEQKDLAPAILQKRQAELQDLMEKNIAFKKEAQRLLRSAREDALAPLRELIFTTLRVIALERGYILVVNTDADACPYLDPERAEDIEDELIQRLNH